MGTEKRERGRRIISGLLPRVTNSQKRIRRDGKGIKLIEASFLFRSTWPPISFFALLVLIARLTATDYG